MRHVLVTNSRAVSGTLCGSGSRCYEHDSRQIYGREQVPWHGNRQVYNRSKS